MLENVISSRKNKQTKQTKKRQKFVWKFSEKHMKLKYLDQLQKN